MTVLKIRTLGDPVLRQVARSVTQDELCKPEMQAFIDDLIETMHDANGAGIAAPQVGRSIALAVVHVKDNPRYPYKPNVPLTVFVNPKLTFLSQDTASIFEGCLSVPGLRGRVRRVMHVGVEAWDRYGQPLSFETYGLTAGTYQHEFDHLEGCLFVDRVEDTSSLTTWSNYESYHKAEFEKEALEIVRRFGD